MVVMVGPLSCWLVAYLALPPVSPAALWQCSCGCEGCYSGLTHNCSSRCMGAVLMNGWCWPMDLGFPAKWSFVYVRLFCWRTEVAVAIRCAVVVAGPKLGDNRPALLPQCARFAGTLSNFEQVVRELRGWRALGVGAHTACDACVMLQRDLPAVAAHRSF